MIAKKYIVMDIETTGLDPWYGDRITCICAKEVNESCYNFFEESNEFENQIINQFKSFLRKYPPAEYTLITKNGRGFDVPFILTRSVLLNIVYELKEILKYPHFDLHLLTKKWVGLDDMAKLLNCRTKSGKGYEAISLWKQRNIRKLTEYCMNDVLVTEEVYKAYMGLKESQEAKSLNCVNEKRS